MHNILPRLPTYQDLRPATSMLRHTVHLPHRYDVILNPLSGHAVEEHFASLTQRHFAVTAGAHLPGVVVATEDTCWVGSTCTVAQRDSFVRARLRADPRAGHRFMHSQMMGTREGLLKLFEAGLASAQTDDMRMLFDYIVADATRVAFDDEELLFATFARGFVSGVSQSDRFDERSLMCWDDVCAVDQKNASGSIGCMTESHEDGNSILLHDARTRRSVAPLMWHVNGPSLAFLLRHPTCAKAVESARGWTWSSFS